jgi:hypothetical protein
MENWRKFLTEGSTGFDMAKSIDYTAFVLDAQSHQRLAALAPEGWKVYSHHMTIINRPNQKQRLPTRWLDYDGCVKVIGIAEGQHVMTALVELEGMPVPMKGPEYPHITIATNPAEGGKPAMSNWKYKPEFSEGNFKQIDPIEVCGKVEEVMR